MHIVTYVLWFCLVFRWTNHTVMCVSSIRYVSDKLDVSCAGLNMWQFVYVFLGGGNYASRYTKSVRYCCTVLFSVVYDWS